jgi:hypothetical protein
LAQLVVDQHWPVARAAERFDVSWKTADKWAQRYRDGGPAAMVDHSSAPHRQARRTPPRTVRRIVSLRRRHRLGPVAIGDLLGMPASTVHAVLVRCRLNRLSHLDRATGERIRRYEHERPGDLLHVDVKKLGKVPDGRLALRRSQRWTEEPRRDRGPHGRPEEQVPQAADRDLLPAHRDR